MQYTLSKVQLSVFISNVIEKNPLGKNEVELKKLIEAAENYDDQILGSNYFLSKIFEKKLKKDIGCESILDKYYNLDEELYFFIEEFNYDFTDMLLTHAPNEKLTLEENLMIIHQNLDERKYGKIVRG